jgi:hypothetical protein
VNLDAAKTTLLSVLAQQTETEDHTWYGFDPQGFERLVHLVEDRDPHWLAKQLRDQQYLLGLRVDIAGMMRGTNANRLLLELLDPAR